MTDSLKTCDTCMFCHYIDNKIGYCGWGRYGKVPLALKGHITDDMGPIDRENPFIGCHYWNPVKQVVNFGVS